MDFEITNLQVAFLRLGKVVQYIILNSADENPHISPLCFHHTGNHGAAPRLTSAPTCSSPALRSFTMHVDLS